MKIQLSDHFTYGRIIRYTLPSIVMMIFTSIYLVVDGLFISNFAGKVAFTAVNLILPVVMMLGTVGFMFGAGGTALVAMTYGEGNKERANRLFSLIVYFAASLGALLGLLGFIFLPSIARLLGAEGELLQNCVVYGRILLLALPFFMLQVMFQSFFSAAEKPMLGLVITLSAGLTNIVLDAILVILLPEEYKLIGAAIATVIAQFVGGFVPIIYFFSKNGSILRLGKAVFDGRALLKVCTNGSSEFMSNISMNIVAILYNLQLMKYAGEDGVAAYGVMMYVSMIFSAIFIGYCIGVSPIVGYHYGAKNQSELQSILKKSIYLLLFFGLAMVLWAELLASPISKIFVGYDPSLYEMTVSGFRIFGLSFVFMGFGMFVSGFFTSLGDGLTSALIAFLRTLVFQVAAILILPLIWELDGVWISIVAAEVMSVALGVFFLIVKRRKYNYF